jgi:pilus assembly protein Flp/PilA
MIPVFLLSFCCSLALGWCGIISLLPRLKIFERRCYMKEKGQGMVEYALILVLVAVVVIAAVTIMGPLVGNVFSTINSSL